MNPEQKATLAQLRDAVERIEAGESEEGAPASMSPNLPSEPSVPQPAVPETAVPELGAPEPSAPDLGSGPSHADEAPEHTYEKARSLVLRKITGSPKSRYQLDKALREKEYPQELISAVLDRLEEVHLIDDAAFARSWVRTRHESKNLGRRMLRQELREKGISEETAEAAVSALSDEDDDSAARELIDNKLRTVSVPHGNSPEDRKERDKIARRLVGSLGRRGHAPGAALKLVREALDERAAQRADSDE